jgi:hypothetical protein
MKNSLERCKQGYGYGKNDEKFGFAIFVFLCHPMWGVLNEE